MNVIVSKLREVSLSVFPISVLVLILHFTISPINTTFIIRFLLGSIFVVLGLTIFLLGVDIGITPLGYLTGVSLAKSNKLWVVLIGGLLLGFSISIAEPGLMVLANQVEVVTSGQIQSISLLVIVSIGLALLLVLGFLRILYNIPLYKLLIVLYFIILGLSIFTSKEFLAISFDASGSTTGILAVPFILSLSVGIAKLKKDSKASEKDSFGLIAIASTGANISIMILDICSKTKQFSVVQDPSIDKSTSVISPFIKLIPENLKESFISIMPLLAILLVLQKIFFKLTKREFRKLLTGFVFAFTGLFLFLNGVYAGFIDIGTSIGQSLVC
ncbi:MAG: Membrane spanning protein [Oscillospiraceae bacterium]